MEIATAPPSDEVMRLVHLQLLPLLSGVQRVSLDEFSELPVHRYERILICKEEGPLSQLMTSIGAKSYFVRNLCRPISISDDFLAFVGLTRILRKLRPHVLHTHSSKTGALGRLAARLAGVPVVVHTVHGFAFPAATSRFARTLYYLIEYVGGRVCDALIVLNESDRKLAMEKLHIRAEKVYLIPNGVNASLYESIDGPARDLLRRRILGLSDDDSQAICVGMIGRLWRQKNPMCLLRASRAVIASTGRAVRFYFIGDGELRGELQREIDAHGVGHSVKILGWRDDVPELLRALDIFVLPSLWEGMPLAILEAMAASVPVIVSNIAGNNELVENSRDGLLFEVDNSDELAEKISMLANDEPMRIALGAAGRSKVINEYSLTSRTRAITDLYSHLLRRRGRKPGIDLDAGGST